MSDLPAVFADGLIQVSMANGVMRLTFGRQTGTNDTEPVGHLFLPIIQVPPTLQAIANALDQFRAEQERQIPLGAPSNNGHGGGPAA